MTIAPSPTGVDVSQAAMAGIGAVVGGVLGMAIGLGLDWFFKRSEAQAIVVASRRSVLSD